MNKKVKLEVTKDATGLGQAPKFQAFFTLPKVPPISFELCLATCTTGTLLLLVVGKIPMLLEKTGHSICNECKAENK